MVKKSKTMMRMTPITIRGTIHQEKAPLYFLSSLISAKLVWFGLLSSSVVVLAATVALAVVLATPKSAEVVVFVSTTTTGAGVTTTVVLASLATTTGVVAALGFGAATGEALLFGYELGLLDGVL